MNEIYWVPISILSVWRITHLFQAEDGPWNFVVHLRRWAGDNFWGKLLDCFYCLSLWFAALLAWLIGEGWTERIILWPALSGGAILLERLTVQCEHPPTAIYYEDEEKLHGVLREAETTDRTTGTDIADRNQAPWFGNSPN